MMRRVSICLVLACALAGCGAGTTIGGPAPNPVATATPSPAPGSTAAPTSPPLATPTPTPTPSPTGTSKATPTATPADTPTPTATPTPKPTPKPTATPTVSPTPVAVASDMVFASIGTGVDVFSSSGALTDTFATATGADFVGLDDTGNAYVLVDNTNFTVTIARYAIGEGGPNAAYVPTSARPQLILVGRNGTLVAVGAGTAAAGGKPTAIYDVWDPGSTGAPSRTITYPNESEVILGGTVASNGTLYLPYNDASGQVRYDVIPAGTSTPSRTIVESLAAANSTFAPNVMAVASDGTLYVGEWTYESPDANAGLYIYPVSGSETKVTTGASNPTGLDFDAAGNVYVANSNAILEPDSTLGSDTAHVLSEFAPGATSLMRQVSSGLDDPQNLAVDVDGTAYLADFENADQSTGSIAVAGPGAAAATAFVPSINADNIVLFDGTRVRSARAKIATYHAARALRIRRFVPRRVRQNS